MHAHTVYLALGSNVGNTSAMLKTAIQRLRLHVDHVHVSNFYRTKPWGDKNQEPFLNCVVKGVTHVSPQVLLAITQAIEHDLGRTKTRKWGPRCIDIDIIMYDELILTTQNLTLPHPYFRQRDFVLIPLLEVAKDLVDPVSGKRVEHIIRYYSVRRAHDYFFMILLASLMVVLCVQ